MNKEVLVFDCLKQSRGRYFVEYRPPISTDRIATLSLVFPGPVEPAEARALMEQELREWLSRYPVPIMVSAYSSDDRIIRIDTEDNKNWLVGWVNSEQGETALASNLSALTEHLDKVPPLNLAAIYHDISFRTQTQIRAQSDTANRLQRRYVSMLKAATLLWILIIPTGIAIYLQFGPEWIGLVALAYSIWKACHSWAKSSGAIKKSDREEKESEKLQKMRHYYYHCERNPNGFLRLKSENLSDDFRDKIQEEAAELAKEKEGR